MAETYPLTPFPKFWHFCELTPKSLSHTYVHALRSGMAKKKQPRARGAQILFADVPGLGVNAQSTGRNLSLVP